MAELYHCFYKEPQGDSILASCFRSVNGKEERNYLFAATHMTKALAFAFSYHDREVISNSGIDGSDNEFVLLVGGQDTLEKKRHIRVFAFPDDGFTILPEARQAVSEKEVPFSKARLILETEDYRDLMRAGLQIFLLPDGMDAYIDSEGHFKGNSFWEKSRTDEAAVWRIMQAYRGRWINQEENINMCPVIQRAFSSEEMSPPSLSGGCLPQGHPPSFSL